MSFLPPGVQYTGPRLIQECSPEELHRRRQAKYDELWGENVGDQLAKGWADRQAQDPVLRDERECYHAYGSRLVFIVPGAPSLKLNEGEVQAEEDMLP